MSAQFSLIPGAKQRLCTSPPLPNLLNKPDAWMMEIKRNEKIINEDNRARACVANISEKIKETRLIWLGHVKRNIEKDV